MAEHPLENGDSVVEKAVNEQRQLSQTDVFVSIPPWTFISTASSCHEDGGQKTAQADGASATKEKRLV